MKFIIQRLKNETRMIPVGEPPEETQSEEDLKNLKRYNNLKADFLKKTEWFSPEVRSQIQEEVSSQIRNKK